MKVSIIIPVYNTGERLRRCLDSVITQTFTDFECVMVDDGSTDYSPAVIDEYAARDNRFVAIHKENGGVSSARNVGLDKAQGEWIAFLDSDDRFKENHLEVLLANADENVDVVFTGYVDVCQDNQNKKHSYIDKLYIGVEEIRYFITQTDVIGYMIPWDKMFRRSLIQKHSIRFDERLALSEDRLFCYKCLLKVNGIATISDVTYIHDAFDSTSLSYRQYPASVNAYCYQAFVRPTELLVEHYNLTSEEMFSFWSYLWSLFEVALISMYDVRKNIFLVSKKQRFFFESNICWALYERVKKTDRGQLFFQGQHHKIIVKKKFLLLNLKHLFRYLLYKSHFYRT